MRLLEGYKIRTITTIENINVYSNFSSGNYSFEYWYNTENEESVGIIYAISDYWTKFKDGDIPIIIDKKIDEIIKINDNKINSKPALQNKLMQYATLFNQKNENYLKKTNRIMLGDTISTKLIVMAPDNLNPKEQILLNKSALISCELDDLLK